MNAKRSGARRRLESAIALLDRIVPAAPLVVVHSSPDLDDSAVALLRAAPADLRLVVLAEAAGPARLRARSLGLDPDLIVARRSPRGAWCYLRSTVAISTHGLFGCRRRTGRKQVVGLWHGEFGKLIGPFVDEPARHFDWVPVSSELSRVMRSAEFALHPSLIHVVGSPRQSLLRAGAEPGGGRAIVWAPTYRTSVIGLSRTDGDPDSLTGVLAPGDPELLTLLERHDATLWFRPHPAADQALDSDSARVRRATNADLEADGLTFYELLAGTDLFVTDYSSLWVDFVLCDRPMIAFCPDLDLYRSNRGLALEPHERWFPGPVVQTRTDFLAALDRALGGEDDHAGRRAETRELLHTAPRDIAVPATWEHVRRALTGPEGDAG